MSRLYVEENCKGNRVPLLMGLNHSCVYRGSFLGSCKHFSVTEFFRDAVWAFVRRAAKHFFTSISVECLVGLTNTFNYVSETSSFL